MAERHSLAGPEPGGGDPKLVELLGEQGVAGSRALLDGFPELVGVLRAVRDDDATSTSGCAKPVSRGSTRSPATPRYMLGTFVERSARLGDGLVNFPTDVTDRGRMKGELRSHADVVAHDLSEPIAGIAML